MGNIERSEQPVGETLSDEEWYDTARSKIVIFLQQRQDTDLKVEVTEVETTPSDKDRGLYHTFVLSFESTSNPSINWTMEIEKSHDYIENKLVRIVSDIYRDKINEKIKEER